MQSMEAKLTEKDCCLIGFIILFQIFQFSHAHDINCTVTQDGGWTLYTVPRMEEAKDCLHSWINMTGHVLANREAKIDELVETNTNYSLRTRECIPIVRYEQNCLSEESLHEAYCNTSCTENTNLDKEEENTHYHKMVAVPFIAIIVAVVLLYSFRKCPSHEAEENQDSSTPL